MKYVSTLVTTLLLLGGSAAVGAKRDAAPPPPPASLDLAAETGFVISVELHGQPLRLRVDPAIGGIILNPDAAEKLGLKQSLASSIMGPKLLVGSVTLTGKSSGNTVLRIGEWSGNRVATWFQRDVVSGADGAIGMADLPHETVTLQLRPERAGDSRFEYATEKEDLIGLIYQHPLAGKQVGIRFSFIQPITQASASAGALFAESHGGAWTGEPAKRPIVYGVSRPVRPLRFERPVSLKGYTFADMLVRTADYRGKYVLPADAPADPNEIVVTANNGKGKAVLRLNVGEDRLAACSSLSYAKATRRLTLTCPAT